MHEDAKISANEHMVMFANTTMSSHTFAFVQLMRFETFTARGIATAKLSVRP